MSDFSRRHFLKSAAMATGLAALSAQKAHAQNADKKSSAAKESGTARPGHVAGGEVLRVGLIGAGGRATGAAIDCVHSSDNVHIVAIGDAFMDRAEDGLKKLQKKIPNACKVTRETLFDGFDNYKKVLNSDIDLVIIATPPGFRPIHLAAAVEAGKHIFAEKPVAVDPAGIRSVIETAKKAKEKGLAIGVGTQRRHHKVYQEIMKRIHEDGAIGDVVGGQCYWMQNGLWVRERQPGWSDMEWQMRNWLYFDWASGDHIVEQHMHNIDVMNWAMGGPPEKAVSSGARMVRTDPKYGNIYDNFNTEFEWPNGVRIDSKCRQWEGASYRVSERIVGTKGTADPSSEIFGENAWKYDGDFKMRDAYVEEHRVLVDNIRNGKPYNELERVAESCLTAIMGRMAAYTGQMVSYKWALKASKLDLTPEKMEFGPHEINPVPVAGKTKLV